MSLYPSASEDCLTRKLPAKVRREVRTLTKFPGADSMRGCEDMMNLSSVRAPALSTRRIRGLLMESPGSGDPHGIAVFEGNLYIARGTAIYRRVGDAYFSLGTVSDTDKQFFVFGKRMYIYPDKVYVASGGTSLTPIATESKVISKAVFKNNTITLPEGTNWATLGLYDGDCLRVVNADDDMPAPEGFYHIQTTDGRVATVRGKFPATYESAAVFRRLAPDLDGVCVLGDRVYGFAGKDILVSAAGSALDFYTSDQTDGRGPATLRMDSEGEITACVAWQGSVIFFKEHSICKLLGTRADSFTLQERVGVGLTSALAGTLCEVGGDLYYMAESGVYRYRGQEPERISPVPEAGVAGGRGGTDGAVYYLSAELKNGESRLYRYHPDEGAWYREDALSAGGMIPWEGFLCIQGGDGNLWLTSSDGRDTGRPVDEWQVNGPVRATLILPPDYDYQPDGCRLTGVVLRATGGLPAAIHVYAEYADGAADKDADGSGWVSLGGTAGNITDRLLRFPVTSRPCDGVRLRIAMSGDWVIHAVMREYERVEW